MLEVQREPDRKLSFVVKEWGKKSSRVGKQSWLLGQSSQGKNREGSGLWGENMKGGGCSQRSFLKTD